MSLLRGDTTAPGADCSKYHQSMYRFVLQHAPKLLMKITVMEMERS